MLLSELIADLQRLQADYGDAKVILDIKVSEKIWKDSEVTSVAYARRVEGRKYVISGNIEKEEKE